MILIGLVFYLDNPPAHCLQVAIPVPPGILTALPTVSTKKVRQMLLKTNFYVLNKSQPGIQFFFIISKNQEHNPPTSIGMLFDDHWK